MVFLFSCSMEKLNCFVKKKDDNGKYHMRTVIAIVSYVIIAISPSVSSLFSFHPSRYRSCVSSMRLVSHLVFVIAPTTSPFLRSCRCHLS